LVQAGPEQLGHPARETDSPRVAVAAISSARRSRWFRHYW
jgi:hypothetical protein